MWLLLMKELIRILFFTWITFRKKWWNNLCGKSEYNIKRTRKRYCIVICREIEYTDSAWCCFSGCQFATPLSFMLCPLLTTPDKPEQTGIYEKFFSPAFHGQPADLPDGRGNFFLSHLHGIILAIFQKCPKRAQKKQETDSWFPVLVCRCVCTAVIQFSFGFYSADQEILPFFQWIWISAV